MHKQISPAWIPSLGMTLLTNIKQELFAKILTMKKHQVKLKKTWISEIGFNVLYHSICKYFDKDICFLEIDNELNV